jgi:hypothetical protein
MQKIVRGTVSFVDAGVCNLEQRFASPIDEAETSRDFLLDAVKVDAPKA